MNQVHRTWYDEPMGEWILVAVGAVFLYFCAYGIVHMLRLRRKGTLKTRRFEDPETGLCFLHPSEWELVAREGKIEFLTHEHDGRVEIRIARLPSGLPDPAAAVLESLARAGIEADEPGPHPFENGPWKGAYAESRASQELERLYLQEWVVDGAGLRIHLRYRCSVLYGQIDGFDIDQLFRSLTHAPGKGPIPT